MKWVEMTSPAIAAVMRDVPLVMNISAVEQHGPHLPVGTDAMIGQYFLDEIEARLSDRVLILPQLKVCCSSHHMDFAGTLTRRHGTILAYAPQDPQPATAHRFRSIVISNKPGGTKGT